MYLYQENTWLESADAVKLIILICVHNSNYLKSDLCFLHKSKNSL